MSRKLLISRTCPLCNMAVDNIPDSIIMKSSNHKGVEFVVTKRGSKQYYHTNCWYEMIARQKEERAMGTSS